MEDLSLHILDIVENAIRAQAHNIDIKICEDEANDLLTIEIEDDGSGMTEKVRKNVLDPFVTTKNTSRVGLGLPLFEQSARMSAGEFAVESVPGKGTKIRATFQHSHIDRKPLGNMAQTILTLIAGHPSIDYTYTHTKKDRSYIFDTKEWKQELEGVPINHPEVLKLIRTDLMQNLATLGAVHR